jgi:hypothetical protein
MTEEERTAQLTPQEAAERGLLGATQVVPGSGHGISKGRSYGAEPGLISGDNSASQLLIGVGYPYLSDLAVGNVIADDIAAMDLDDVAVADVSHTPVAAAQTVAEGSYERVIITGAEKIGDGLNTGTPSEDPGTIHRRTAADYPVPGERIVDRIAECAMGSNTIENVVIVTKAICGLPVETQVLTIEPEYDSWGFDIEEFSDPVAAAMSELSDEIVDLLGPASVSLSE